MDRIKKFRVVSENWIRIRKYDNGCLSDYIDFVGKWQCRGGEGAMKESGSLIPKRWKKMFIVLPCLFTDNILAL